MKKLQISNTAKAILPAIILIPISIQLISNLHIGGISTLCSFFTAAIHPSTNQNVINNSWHGLQITLCIATIAWCISISFGILLGILSSYSINNILGVSRIITTTIRRLLTLPRATHELLWGLLLLQIFGLAPWIAIIAISIPYASLMERIFAEQIDLQSFNDIQAIKQTGAAKTQILVTALLPKIIPFIGTYGCYRLECAVRGATLLGIFGLGGIGTELQLSTLSMKFDEMWTSLWMLFITIFLLEKLLERMQKPRYYFNKIGEYTLYCFAFIFSLFILNLFWIRSLGINILDSFEIHLVSLPTLESFSIAISTLPWLSLIWETLLLTFLAACIAISLPPILLMLCPTSYVEQVISTIWIFCRLIPPPLSSILLLLCIQPNISVAAIALGIQNMGVLGRILKESLDKNNTEVFNAISSTGAKSQSSWLYGKLCF